MHANGLGVAHDYKQAAAWYRKAAVQGHAGAQINLGVMYADGQGMAQDFVEAHKWFDVAATQGDEHARKNRDNLEHKMSNEQIAEAQRQASKWLKSQGTRQK